MDIRSLPRYMTVAAVVAAAVTSLTACTNSGTESAEPSLQSSSSKAGEPSAVMNGLESSTSDMALITDDSMIPAGQATTWRFRIDDSGGGAVTEYEAEQGQLMHLYFIRDDSTRFAHLHPIMAGDGTWSAPISGLVPGRYRVYAQFRALSGKTSETQVLSQLVTVPGEGTPERLPHAMPSTSVDGYTLTVAGKLTPGQSGELTVDIAGGDEQGSDVQRYEGAYVHVTAIHAQTLAFADLTPLDSDQRGPEFDVPAKLSKSGDWRLFIEFQTGGQLHTAAITIAL